MYIYSSGSVLSQKLLFGHSSYGDLIPFFDGFFDTTIGMKVDSDSYTKIFDTIRHEHPDVTAPSEILFLTDNYQEAVAAEKIGISVLVSIRPNTKQLPHNITFRTINSFDEI